jgi:hypothetical protein
MVTSTCTLEEIHYGFASFAVTVWRQTKCIGATRGAIRNVKTRTKSCDAFVSARLQINDMCSRKPPHLVRSERGEVFLPCGIHSKVRDANRDAADGDSRVRRPIRTMEAQDES